MSETILVVITNGGMAMATLMRVLLVDDHVMVRQGIRALLETYPNIEVVGEAGDGGRTGFCK